MIKVLEQAVERVKKLSKDQQEYAAEVLEKIAEAATVYRPSRGRSLEDFLNRAQFRSKDKNLSKKIDEIVYGASR